MQMPSFSLEICEAQGPHGSLNQWMASRATRDKVLGPEISKCQGDSSTVCIRGAGSKMGHRSGPPTQPRPASTGRVHPACVPTARPVERPVQPHSVPSTADMMLMLSLLPSKLAMCVPSRGHHSHLFEAQHLPSPPFLST